MQNRIKMKKISLRTKLRHEKSDRLTSCVFECCKKSKQKLIVNHSHMMRPKIQQDTVTGVRERNGSGLGQLSCQLWDW